MSDQDHDIEADNAEEQTLYRTTGPMMTRRNVLRTGAAVGAATAMPVGASTLGYSPVGKAQAVAPIPIMMGAAVVVAATATAYTHWYADRDEDRLETATLSQAHRDIHDISRGFDASSDEEEEFENLVAERAHYQIWEQAVWDFGVDYNETDKSLSQLKSEMRAKIREEYAKYQTEIVGNLNADVQQIADFFARLDDYGHADHLSNIIEYESRRNSSGGNSIYPDWNTDWTITPDMGRDHEDYETYNITGDEEIFNPYWNEYDDAIRPEDVVYRDYELVDGETVEMAIGWGSMVWADPSVSRLGRIRYYDQETDTITGVLTGETNLGGIRITPPDSAESYHTMLHLQRRQNAISTLEEESVYLSQEVDVWVDEMASLFARGDLPVRDLVSAPFLFEEFGFEEGNPSLTNLYLSKLGYGTDIAGSVTITNLGTGFDPESDDPDEVGTTLGGHLATDVDESFQKGELYNAADYEGDILFVGPSGDVSILDGWFRVEEIVSYEGGETTQQETYTPKSYTFSPRDPNRYLEDLEATSDAREDATENPNTDKTGGGLGFGESGSRLALLVVAVVAGVAALLGLNKDDQRGRRN